MTKPKTQAKARPSRKPQNRAPEGKPRDGGGRFKKGVSGNPGGRPKALVEVKALAAEYTPDAINSLYVIAMAGRDERARVQAAVALLDRAWGKPTQAVEMSGPAGGPVETEVRAEVRGADGGENEADRVAATLEVLRRAGLMAAGDPAAVDAAGLPVVAGEADAAAGGVPVPAE